jgi:proteic killer suppression protein
VNSRWYKREKRFTITLDVISVLRYYILVIKSFGDKETERLFRREFSRRLPVDIQQSARRKLEIIDAAEAISDLRIPPSNHLEKLSGDRNMQHSIRINDRWRICFEWRDGDAYEVEVVDYH